MNRIFTIILVSFFSILLLFSVASFKQNMEVPAINSSLFKEVDSIVISKMNAYNIPGLAIGLVRNDSLIYTKGYGLRNIEDKNPVSEYSVFHTASISKLFTASAIIKLIDENQLSLDDKVYQLIPELQLKDERIKEITIKDLLNHTSGLPDVWNYHWEDNNQAETSLKNYVSNLEIKLKSTPATSYAYSNLGYNLLGYIIEKKTQSSFDDYLKTTILNPSGMPVSDFRYFKIPDSLTVTPYTKNRTTGKIKERDVYPYTREQAASSTLNASAYELSNWMISFLKETKQDDLESAMKLTLRPDPDNVSPTGLGFQQYSFDTKHAVGHFGGDKGFRSFLMMIPEENIGLVILGNCDYNEDYRQEILYPIATLMLAKPKLQ